MPEPIVPSPLTVWPVSQHHPRVQRKDRYTPASTAHPAKMLPALAARLIATFTRPGDLVLDPMCGIGTTLVEAIHLGRHGLGIEYEPRWATVARANITHAASQGATGTATVLTGDARDLSTLATQFPAVHGRPATGNIALVLTSPPYGKATHGQVDAHRDNGVHKRDYHYGQPRRGNLAHSDLPELLTGFSTILTATAALLRPDGLVAVTVRPYRHDGELIDLPGAITERAPASGLVRAGRAEALLAGLRDTGLVPRTTFFALHNARTAWQTGRPLHVLAHEDVLLLTLAPRPDGRAEESFDRRPDPV
ncbi:TRM11 family SAM-dependent methyltransferase [Pseudofrankia saprophytica]|uniref:TRM11 family SAM-dependent methyltransferase n=1 Tax=Pseudofrankia saprophytica TaxID=298655 RepID=UPI000234B19A|nr:DNA methyltransferase [Pseudofrankia saprophytica]